MSAQFWWLMVLGGLASSMIPLQGIVNGRLGATLANPLLASLISFVTGTVVIFVTYCFVHRDLPRLTQLSSIPWYLYIGGTIGFIYITVVLMVVPKIGPANLLAASIIGQMVMALLLDHWGVLGIPQIPISLTRICGVALLFAGTWMIQRG